MISVPVGTRLAVGEKVLLEVTQIGKKCHSGCAIFRQAGKCITPKEGVFTSVVRAGIIKPGDDINFAHNE